MGYRYHVIARASVLLPLLIMMLVQLLYIKRRGISISGAFPERSLIGLYFLIWAVAYTRTAQTYSFPASALLVLDFLSMMTISGVVFLAFCLAPDEKAFILRSAVVLSFGLYLLSNLILYGLEIQPHDQIFLAKYPRQMLAILGFPGDRVLFPMANGLNDYGSLAAVAITGSFFLLFNKDMTVARIAGVCTLFVSLISILLTDSRGALLASILIITMMLVLGQFPRLLLASAILISFFPVIITLISPSWRFDWLHTLSRQPSGLVDENAAAIAYGDECERLLNESSGILTNRPVIWNIALREFLQPEFSHLYGYGYRGQVASGLSSQYSCLFTSYATSKQASTHNMWLQLLVETGYTGLFVVLGILSILNTKLSQAFADTSDYAFKAMQAIIICMVLIGSLEASFSPDFQELFVFGNMILVAAFASSLKVPLG